MKNKFREIISAFGIYIEVCGSKDFEYEYRRITYKENGYNVTFLHLFKDTNKWKYYLINYLCVIINFKNKELNKLLKMKSF